jgi:hypothetical protein
MTSLGSRWVCNVRDFNRAFLVGVLRISTGYFFSWGGILWTSWRVVFGEKFLRRRVGYRAGVRAWSRVVRIIWCFLVVHRYRYRDKDRNRYRYRYRWALPHNRFFLTVLIIPVGFIRTDRIQDTPCRS